MKFVSRSTLTVILTALVTLAVPAFAKETPNWQTATVLAQDYSTQAAGAYAAPIGAGVIGVPLYRRTNHVVVETGLYRYEWSEIGRNNTVILPVHSQIQFYQDGNYFVVLDSKNHKHKFALVGMTAKQ